MYEFIVTEAVVAEIKAQSADDGGESAAEFKNQLKELTPEVKEIALKTKKPGSAANNDE